MFRSRVAEAWVGVGLNDLALGYQLHGHFAKAKPLYERAFYRSAYQKNRLPIATDGPREALVR